MSADSPMTGWTLEAYIAHNEAMRAAHQRFEDERDQRYMERDLAQKAAAEAAMKAANTAAEKTEQALKEYKVGANEWRTTVSDLIASRSGQFEGAHASWTLLLGTVALIATLIAIGSFVFRPTPQTPQTPQIFYVPAAPGTLVPSPTQVAPR